MSASTQRLLNKTAVITALAPGSDAPLPACSRGMGRGWW